MVANMGLSGTLSAIPIALTASIHCKPGNVADLRSEAVTQPHQDHVSIPIVGTGNTIP